MKYRYMKCEHCWLFHDGGRHHIETSPLICRANQWTGFNMITVSVMKELNKMALIKSFLVGALYSSKLIYLYLNKGNNVCEMLQLFEIDDTSTFTCWLFQNIFMKHVSFKPFYWYIKLLQSSTIFKQRNSYEVSSD